MSESPDPTMLPPDPPAQPPILPVVEAGEAGPPKPTTAVLTEPVAEKVVAPTPTAAAEQIIAKGLIESEDTAVIDETAVNSSDNSDGDELPPFQPIDPALIYLVLLGVIVLGLNTLLPDVRYTLVWTVLIVVGLLSILFDRLEVEIPNALDMLWGIGFGALIGVPLLLIAIPPLKQTSLAMFAGSTDSFVFQSLALVMPAAETLFFRGRSSRRAACCLLPSRPASGRCWSFFRSCTSRSFHWWPR